MTRPTGEDAMSSEHVEVLERLRGVLEHGKMGDKCLIAPDLVTAAIAALSAPQPPAEAQPVAWEWEYIGGDHYPRGHKVARSLREMDPTNPPYPETWRPTRPLIYGDIAPPSAPVGVEGLPPDVQEIVRKDDAAWALAERAEAAGAERDSDDDGAWWTLRIEHFKALAQQPAAVDSEMVIRAVNAYDEATGEGWQMPCLQGMRAALTAALAAQQGGES